MVYEEPKRAGKKKKLREKVMKLKGGKEQATQTLHSDDRKLYRDEDGMSEITRLRRSERERRLDELREHQQRGQETGKNKGKNGWENGKMRRKNQMMVRMGSVVMAAVTSGHGAALLVDS
jgi:hypothetical protein